MWSIASHLSALRDDAIVTKRYAFLWTWSVSPFERLYISDTPISEQGRYNPEMNGSKSPLVSLEILKLIIGVLVESEGGLTLLFLKIYKIYKIIIKL